MFGEKIICGNSSGKIDEKGRFYLPKFTGAEQGEYVVIKFENTSDNEYVLKIYAYSTIERKWNHLTSLKDAYTFLLAEKFINIEECEETKKKIEDLTIELEEISKHFVMMAKVDKQKRIVINKETLSIIDWPTPAEIISLGCAEYLLVRQKNSL